MDGNDGKGTLCGRMKKALAHRLAKYELKMNEDKTQLLSFLG